MYLLKKSAERKFYVSGPHVAEEMEENICHMF